MNLATFVPAAALVVLFCGTVAVTATTRAALAQDHAPRHPAEAYAACASKDEGAACSDEVRGRAFQGVCAPDQEQRLICRPKPPPPRP